MAKRKTNEEINNEIKLLTKNEFELVGEYITNRIKIKIKHNKCGNIFEKDLLHFRKRQFCPYCKGIDGIKNRDSNSFKEEIKNLTNNEYKVLGDYVNIHTKVEFKHNKCNNTFLSTPNNFLKVENKCPYCRKRNVNNKKKTTDEFKKEIFNLFGNEYSVLGKYINSQTKIDIKHNLCNNTYQTTPNIILKGHKCPYCQNKKKKTTEEFMNEISLLDDSNEYQLLSEYKNNKEKINFKHLLCNKEFKMRPNDFLNGYRCPHCYGNTANKKTTEEIKEKIYKLVGDEFSMIDEYINCREKIKLRHNKCGTEFLIKSNEFIVLGNRCPYCKSSKGEKLIQNFLEKNNIKFISQKRFNNCRDKLPLPFDFYLEDYNLCIEYDGEFHYEVKKFVEGKDYNKQQLELTQKHDRMKNEYCENNNIKLLRISYKEKDDIERIIDEALFEIDHSTIV